MPEKINQKNNTVQNGDIIGRDKYETNLTFLDTVIATQKDAIRGDVQFEFKEDGNNSVLITKLQNGGFLKVNIDIAIDKKVKALELIIEYNKTAFGRKILADIYENLITTIQIKYMALLESGETLKADLKDIYKELSLLVIKYRDLINIDEAFLVGLIYVATSNCAIWWKANE